MKEKARSSILNDEFENQVETFKDVLENKKKRAIGEYDLIPTRDGQKGKGKGKK